jgi:hypothetical protein
MNNLIRDNLYEFYDLIAQVGALKAEKHKYWSVSENIPGFWPRVIYRIKSDILTRSSSVIFSEKVKSGTYPELLIAPDENIREIDPFLREKGFYPFSAWQGMAISSLNENIPFIPPETNDIVKIENTTDIDQWIKIVSTELIAPSLMNKTLLKSLLAQPSIKAYLLKYNGIGVSTILVFDSVSSTGLYLIATEKTSQRQGFASLLVQYILSQNSLSSKNPVILHATQLGGPMYLKLGFQPFNQFFLYRYLKPNP